MHLIGGRIAFFSRSQSLTALTAAVVGSGDEQGLSELKSREAALEKEQSDKKLADDLAKQIKEITDSNAKTSTYDLLTGITAVQSALNADTISAQAKYTYYKALADTLQSLLSAQISQTARERKTRIRKPTRRRVLTPRLQTPVRRKPQLIWRSSSAWNPLRTTLGKALYDRTNSLLLRDHAARNQEDMAKLDADYQTDLIAIYSAEINARLRGKRFTSTKANRALVGTTLSEQGFATIPLSF